MDVSETLSFSLPDLAATARLGAALASVARVGDVIALRGDLGAGKTELARATIRAAVGDPDLIVPSPTFTLLETYDTPRGAWWHFDLYRLDAPDQVYELGWEDALADAIALVEWPERLGPLLPDDRLDLGLETLPDQCRRATLAGGNAWRERLPAVAKAMAHG